MVKISGEHVSFISDLLLLGALLGTLSISFLLQLDSEFVLQIDKLIILRFKVFDDLTFLINDN